MEMRITLGSEGFPLGRQPTMNRQEKRKASRVKRVAESPMVLTSSYFK